MLYFIFLIGNAVPHLATACCSAGLDQDQFVRLLRQPGELWKAWDVWVTEANGGDGVFPSQEELDELDGIVITGDRCAWLACAPACLCCLWCGASRGNCLPVVAPAAAAAACCRCCLLLLPAPLLLQPSRSATSSRPVCPCPLHTSGSPSQAALATLQELIVEQAAKGQRILVSSRAEV